MQSISPQALELLERHDWPGNVRELQSVVREALIVSAGPHHSGRVSSRGVAPRQKRRAGKGKRALARCPTWTGGCSGISWKPPPLAARGTSTGGRWSVSTAWSSRTSCGTPADSRNRAAEVAGPQPRHVAGKTAAHADVRREGIGPAGIRRPAGVSGEHHDTFYERPRLTACRCRSSPIRFRGGA